MSQMEMERRALVKTLGMKSVKGPPGETSLREEGLFG